VEVGEHRIGREAVADVETASTAAPYPGAPADGVERFEGHPASPLFVSMAMWRGRYALRRALVDLADARSEPATVEARSLAAGQAALALADVGDAVGLASILRPDPAVEPAAWTVACYEIGHLAPTALRDLSDPSEAVKLLVACPEVSHLAAELVVSTTDGLRWTALVRAGSVLRLRLPSESNASGESHLAGQSASGAEERWQAQLKAWSTESDPATEATWSPPATPSIDVAVASALEAAATVHAAEMEAAAIRHAAEMDAAATRYAAALEEARLVSPTPEPVRTQVVVGRRLGALLAAAATDDRVPEVVRRWAGPAARARLPARLSSIPSASVVHRPHA
jgi:hypothetical protein